MDTIVIIGAGHAGGRAALALRDAGWGGAIRLIGAESTPPYERPPLSKAVLLGAPFGALLGTARDYARLGVEWIGGRRAVSINREARQVLLEDGQPLDYGQLLIATGGFARRLSIPGAGLEGVLTLRTLEDAQALAPRLAEGQRLLVIGGGFIGLEVAASARARGCAVELLSGGLQLLARTVPRELSSRLERLHVAHGVKLHMGVVPQRIERGPEGSLQVRTSNGQSLEADTIVVGIGLEPNTALASGAGLTCADGVVVDAALRTNDPAIFAAGDVASLANPLGDGFHRRESWHNAEDLARVAAVNLCGGNATICTSPWFWSEQYDHTIQVVGMPQFASNNVMRPLASGGLIDFHLDAGGRLVAASGFGMTGSLAKEFKLARLLVEERARPSPAALADPAVKLKSLLRFPGS